MIRYPEWAVVRIDHKTGEAEVVNLWRHRPAAASFAAEFAPADHWQGRFEVKLARVTTLGLDYNIEDGERP